jgi:hypothetical protein
MTKAEWGHSFELEQKWNVIEDASLRRTVTTKLQVTEIRGLVV